MMMGLLQGFPDGHYTRLFIFPNDALRIETAGYVLLSPTLDLDTWETLEASAIQSYFS